MKRVAQGGYQTTDIADDLATVHDTGDADAIDPATLKPAIAFVLDATADDIRVTDVTPTENSARPSSVLLVDFTADGESLVAEVQCTEQMTFADEGAVEQHDDGSMSFPISAVGEPRHNYETVDVIIYTEQ